MNTTTTNLHELSRPGRSEAVSVVATPPARWKTRVLLPGAVLATIVVLLLMTSLQTLLPATPVRIVPTVAKTVEGATGTVTVQAPGWLEPDPHPYYVAALADGFVDEVLALEGERVETGQVIARLVDDDAHLNLRRTEAELAQRRAESTAAQANLTGTRLILDNLVDRTRMEATTKAVVAEVTAELAKADADIAVERAKLLELQDEFERKSKLTESQAVSEAAVARLRLRVDAQKATVDATIARKAILEAKLRQAEADHRAAVQHKELLIEEQRDLALAEAAVANAEAAVLLAEAVRDEAALQLERMEVRSPVNGIVLRRLASPGSKLVRGGDEHAAHVIHVYDPANLQVRVDVPLADAAHVSIGQTAEVVVDVLPDRTFTATVTRVVHQADIQKNTVEVKVAIDNPSEQLKPEMLARVKFLAADSPSEGASSTRQRVFAPRALLQRGGDGGDSVFVVADVVNRRGRVERRSITAGRRVIDGWIEIDAGLNVGDLMIADPSPDLEPGDRVRIVGEQALAGGA